MVDAMHPVFPSAVDLAISLHSIAAEILTVRFSVKKVLPELAL